MGGTLLRHLLEFAGRITKLLHLLLNTEGRRDGGLVVKLSQSGNIPAQVRSCGYMGSVSVCAVIISPQFITFNFAAGAGKSILW